MYYLAEYINMATVSAVATTLFLGGFNAPWPLNGTFLDRGWFTLIWFFLKTELMIFFFIWVRGALPRLRYDQFMNLGWKVLIPVSLVWIVMIAIVRGGMAGGWLRSPLFLGAGAGVLLLILGLSFLLDRDTPESAQPDADALFDAFAGGYPVPPMLGQTLPELASVVPSTVVTTTVSTTTDGADN